MRKIPRLLERLETVLAEEAASGQVAEPEPEMPEPPEQLSLL
jgi:hypothetical protein